PSHDSRAVLNCQNCGRAAAEQHRQGQREEGRERPLLSAPGQVRGAGPGSLTPLFLSISIAISDSGGTKRRRLRARHVAPTACSAAASTHSLRAVSVVGERI